MFKKNLLSLVAIVLVLCTIICQSPMAAAVATDETAFVTSIENTNENGEAVVKTWKNNKGETRTAIITMGEEVLVANTNPSEGEAAGFVTTAPESNVSTPLALDERQVSKTFYMQIYNDNNEIITKYKVTVVGMVSRVSSDGDKTQEGHYEKVQNITCINACADALCRVCRVWGEGCKAHH